jgi:hypothetical protein
MSEHNELDAMETKLNTIGMSNSERVVAIGALRRAFILHEQWAWITHWKLPSLRRRVRKELQIARSVS